MRQNILPIFISLIFCLTLFLFFTVETNKKYIECVDLPITNQGGSDQLDYFLMSSGVKEYKKWIKSSDNIFVKNWIEDLQNYKSTNSNCFKKFAKNIEYTQQRISSSAPDAPYSLRPWGFPTLLSIILFENNTYFTLRLFNVVLSLIAIIVIYFCIKKITNNYLLSSGLTSLFIIISYFEIQMNQRLSIFNYQFVLLTEITSFLIFTFIAFLIIKNKSISNLTIFLFFLTFLIKQMNFLIFIVYFFILLIYKFLKSKKLKPTFFFKFIFYLILCIPVFNYNYETTGSSSLITGAGGWRDIPPSFSLDYKIENFYSLRQNLLDQYIEEKNLEISGYIEIALISREMFFENFSQNIKNFPSLFLYKVPRSLNSYSGILTTLLALFYIFLKRYKNEGIDYLVILFISNLLFVNVITSDFGRHLFQTSFLYILIFAYLISNNDGASIDK